MIKGYHNKGIMNPFHGVLKKSLEWFRYFLILMFILVKEMLMDTDKSSPGSPPPPVVWLDIEIH